MHERNNVTCFTYIILLYLSNLAYRWFKTELGIILDNFFNELTVKPTAIQIDSHKMRVPLRCIEHQGATSPVLVVLISCWRKQTTFPAISQLPTSDKVIYHRNPVPNKLGYVATIESI